MTPQRDLADGFVGQGAERYDRRFDSPGSDGQALRDRLARTVELIGSGSGDVLDAGMGAGRLCEALTRNGWKVSGIDASEAMVELARQRVPTASDRLVQGVLEKMPFGDAQFDVAVATGVLEFSELDSALAELSRVVKAGGMVLVSYPNPRSMHRWWKTRVYYRAIGVAKHFARDGREPPRGAPLLSLERFAELLDSNGIEPVGRHYVGFHVVLPPISHALPTIAERLAKAVARRAPRLGPILAGQIIFTGRKRAAPAAPSARLLHRDESHEHGVVERRAPGLDERMVKAGEQIVGDQ